MSARAGDTKSFFLRGLQVLGYAFGLITAIQFGSSIFASGEWAAATTDVYQATIYPLHDKTYVLAASPLNINVTSRFKDLLTIYIAGCAAQLHYLNYLDGKVRPILGLVEKIPVIIFIELRHKLIYIFLWPIIIIFDCPFIFRSRPILSWLINDTRRRTRKDVYEEWASSPYLVTVFLQGFVVALLILLIFVLTNAR
jgi:hypothetical protein